MTKKENVAERETMKEAEAAPRIIAAMIRQSSEGGQLISEAEILRRANETKSFLPRTPRSGAKRLERSLRN